MASIFGSLLRTNQEVATNRQRSAISLGREMKKQASMRRFLNLFKNKPFQFLLLVLVVGVEPTRPFELRILSPVRLPFRHTSIYFKRDDLNLEVPPGFEPGNKGVADLCLTTWRWYHMPSSSLFNVLNISQKVGVVKHFFLF